MMTMTAKRNGKQTEEETGELWGWEWGLGRG